MFDHLALKQKVGAVALWDGLVLCTRNNSSILGNCFLQIICSSL